MLKYPESTENRTDNITHPVSAAPRAFCNSQHLMTCGQSACLCSQAAFNSLQLIKPFTESHYRARHLCWGCTNMNKCQGLQELFVSREDRWRVSAHSWQALSCTKESVERWGSWDAACAPVDKLCVWLWRKGWLFLICTNGQGVLPAALDWGTALLLLLLLLSRFSRIQLCDPIDGSPPGSPVPGILQARTMEWVAISFSNAWKWKVKEKSFSHVWLLVTPWTAAHQAPLSMGFSRQEYWSGVPLPSLEVQP